MPRTSRDKTKKRLLAAAEKLFSKRGFDATSVDQIARTAGVNKALIYYYFEDKNHLIVSLFTNIIEELEVHIGNRPDFVTPDGEAVLKQKIHEEIEFLASRKRILSLMLAEALKSDQCDDFLFRCAQIAIVQEHGKRRGEEVSGGTKSAEQALWVHEFFTGFMPLIAFVTLRDKWCDFFCGDPAKIQEHFVEAFIQSHNASHFSLE